ncbi:circadian clock-controlled protein daywake-like [Amyelois transitella]|uniref:circadian clock-controlled protein daywake-like n=1 Tax=Amyelois transitella TaxID=680683 RepID=UPI00067B60ED|nr:circadian clock-controlled protein daywake-like [Amyelois transitella]
MIWFIVVCVSAFILGTNSAKAPFVKPCKASDDDCLIESGRATLSRLAAGIPSLGVPSADPLIIGDIRGDSGDLKLAFRNMKVEGISKCQMINLEASGVNAYRTVLECPIAATGQYTLGGKLAVIPAEGDGDFEIKTDNIKITVEYITTDVTDEEGVKHWKIASYQSSYEPIEKVHIKLDNLFNGNKEKADPVLEILDQGWKDLITEIGKPIIQKIIDRGVTIVDKFFEAVPSEELTINA